MVLAFASVIGLGAASAATSAPHLNVESPKACWVHTRAGYIPRVTLTTTPTEKLEALAINVQFLGAGQPSAPVLSLQYDAEANIHYASVLKGRHTLVALPPSGTASVRLTARILPYAARNTTTLGKMQVVSLGSVKLGSAICKS